MTALRRALIVPAMSSGPDDHWYPDLRQQLGSAGFIDIRTAHLPDGEPLLEEWLAAIALEIDGVDESTLVVGHSLGAVAALAYLTAHADVQAVGRHIGVAGFSSALPGAPWSRPFVDAVDSTHIRTAVHERLMLVSTNDYAVLPAMTEAAAIEIDARLHRVQDAGHFLAADGWTTAGLIGEMALRPRDGCPVSLPGRC